MPFLPRLLTALADAGVTLHGDDTARAAHDAVVPATDEDWATEYLSLDMAVRVVDDLPQALEHIARWGTGHSEAIVADSAAAIAAVHTDAPTAADTDWGQILQLYDQLLAHTNSPVVAICASGR